MGSAATSLSSSPEDSDHSEKRANHKPAVVDMSLTHREITNQRTLVRASRVAPIIIKNCNEEYQHITDITDPISYGRISTFTQEHALIQNEYFLVEDVNTKIDRLATMDQYLIPNLRACRGNWPIYGLGQPSSDGLAQLLTSLKDEGHKDLLVFNLRAEPVLFARRGYDLHPYSLRSRDKVDRCAYMPDYTAQQINDWESRVRKETSDLAALLTENNSFYLYDHHEGFFEEPRKICVANEDDLAVTEEVYHRHTFYNPAIRYCRLPLTPDGTPHEKIFDNFLSVFHALPNFFNRDEPCRPAMLFTSRSGVTRATFGMILGSLIMARKHGFTREQGKSTDLNICADAPKAADDFYSIQNLVQYLHNGHRIKQEVDRCIDMSDELFDIRSTIAELRVRLSSDSPDQTDDDKRATVEECRVSVERYFYLICFNAYLHEQYECSFGTSFLEWMQQQPRLYNILQNLNTCERKAPPSLLDDGLRVLVADDPIDLDVLSSFHDVQVANFRRITGLPVYGMAQPTKSGLESVVSHLLTKKEPHPTVVVCNLREDLVLELDGVTYCWRESHQPDKPVNFVGIPHREIEEIEAQLKKDRKKKKLFQVKTNPSEAAETREFGSFLTQLDIHEILENSKVSYHRIPIPDNKAPMEQDFDAMMSSLTSLKEIHTDEDGPALLFYCRTGKGRTTVAMAIAGLIYCHLRGFPCGSKPGMEERVSLPNATYTKGNFEVVRDLVQRIPQGQQVKREVDFILDQVSDTMTPMHYHIREIIFVTLKKVKKAEAANERAYYMKRSLDFLERYIYLILFNAYLHCERRANWRRSFTTWMQKVAAKAGVYKLLDNLGFPELGVVDEKLSQRRYRWTYQHPNRPRPTLFL